MVLYAPAFMFFCKYWPDNGLIRPKLVANSSITVKCYTIVSAAVHISFQSTSVLQTQRDVLHVYYYELTLHNTVNNLLILRRGGGGVSGGGKIS